VENEIGMLPNARDYHPQAQKAFASPVPEELTEYLVKNKNTLMPEFLSVWEKAGSRQKGTWQELFGNNIAAEEIFMAWYFVQYVEGIAAAGKAVYPIPLYVNAALNRPGRLPGEYPSAGPLPHLMDLWKAASPSIDFLSPDIYFEDFAHWCALYDRGGNPLFLPEVRYERSFGWGSNYETACGPKAFYAFGNHDAMGFSPFFIESTSYLVEEPIAPSYQMRQNDWTRPP
jgi:beta-galactosidase GanA